MNGFSRIIATLLLIAIAAVGLSGCISTSDPLEGTEWKLTGWTVSSIDPASVTITAEFAEGRLSGNSGVNTYSGPYKAGPDATFSAGPLAATEMAGPEPVMRAETAYLTLLGQAKSYEVTGSRLTLFDGGENESLIFERVGK